MKTNSYLLVLDGSAESCAAAFLAWKLAKDPGARVVAQHVIDIPAVETLLPCGKAGFIGSGPYIQAREQTVAALRSVAETLMLSYRAQAEGRNIDIDTYIDEGDPVDEICKRAQEHELVIIGHDSLASQEKLSGFCEKIEQSCPRPILFVNAAGDVCNKLRALVAVAGTGVTLDTPKYLAS